MASEDERIARVLAALRREVPPGWRRIVFTVWATVALVQTEFAVTMVDGSTPDMSLRAPEADLAELRSEMYVPQRGTWFSARFVLTGENEPEVRFNYDDDPQWFPDIPSWIFARDLATFPRADEHVPGWLRERLDVLPRPTDERTIPG
ncbi:hypothetical protein [Lentzea sp. NPDC055074]